MAIAELSFQRRMTLHRKLIDRFNRQIASQLVNHPPVRRHGDCYFDDRAASDAPDEVYRPSIS